MAILRFKIKDIPTEGQLFSQALEPTLLGEALAGTDAELERTAGAIEFELTRSADDVYVRGRLTATVGLPCALCLEPARAQVDVPVKMVYTYGDQGEDDEDEERADADPVDDADYDYHDGEILDLAHLVRELLILNLPMSPRCRESCKGLCSMCGQNLNERDCGHTSDERSSALAEKLKNVNLEPLKH